MRNDDTRTRGGKLGRAGRDQLGSPFADRGIVTESFQPNDIGLAAKPCHLTLGVVAMSLLRGRDRLLPCQLAAKMLRAPADSRASREPSTLFCWAHRSSKDSVSSTKPLSNICCSARVDPLVQLLRVRDSARFAKCESPVSGSRPRCCHCWLMGPRDARQTSIARISLGASLAWILAASRGIESLRIRADTPSRVRRHDLADAPAIPPSAAARETGPPAAREDTALYRRQRSELAALGNLFDRRSGPA